MANEPPPDHESNQEESDDDKSSSEVSQKADRLEFIRDFQEIMNKAIKQLLDNFMLVKKDDKMQRNDKFQVQVSDIILQQ